MCYVLFNIYILLILDRKKKKIYIYIEKKYLYQGYSKKHYSVMHMYTGMRICTL